MQFHNIMHQFKSGLIASILFIFFISSAYSQGLISPYSAYGMGLISEKGYASNNGMGNAGIAYQSPWFIPVLNPALLGSQTFTAFESGLSITQNNISDEVRTFRQVNGGLKYIALALPIVPGKYGVSISLRPYSSKNYKIIGKTNTGSGPQAQTTQYEGSGSVSQFSLANGWNITKNIAVGLEANYNFGNLTDKTIYQNILHNQDTILLPYLVSAENSVNFSDFSFILGTKLTKKIGENNLSFGLTYDIQANLNSTRNHFVQLTNSSGTPLDPIEDKDYFKEYGKKGVTVIPDKLSAGLTYMKLNKWAISTDFSYQDWSKYSSFGNAEGALSEELNINLGGEFTPNPQSGTKYVERMTYRAGLNISNGPLVINGTSINSFGITFGSTLPISKISNINLAFEVGQRGTLVNNLVQENYLNFNLSFTFNDRWFLRRQFD